MSLHFYEFFKCMKKKERKEEGRGGRKEGREKGGKERGRDRDRESHKRNDHRKMNSRASQLLGDQTHLGSSPWFLGLPKTKPSKSFLLPAPELLDGTRRLRSMLGCPLLVTFTCLHQVLGNTRSSELCPLITPTNQKSSSYRD